jgi:hypothetical protein
MAIFLLKYTNIASLLRAFVVDDAPQDLVCRGWLASHYRISYSRMESCWKHVGRGVRGKDAVFHS